MRLSPIVYLFRASSAIDKRTATNSVAVITSDGVLVFDSNTLPGTTLRVLARIRQLTRQPVRVLVNSPWHMDHWSGNAVCADGSPTTPERIGAARADLHETEVFDRKIAAIRHFDDVARSLIREIIQEAHDGVDPSRG